MKIREVLNADWTVCWIGVTVREKGREGYCKYIIGRDVKPTKYMRFLYETEAGEIYTEGSRRVVIIKKNIQYKWKREKPAGKGMCVGVLEKNIPKELLDLMIMHMSPSGLGASDDMHGYEFECCVDFWSGIQGECEQMSLAELQKEQS